MSSENKAIVRGLLEAFDSGDLSRMGQFVARNFVLRFPAGEANGFEALLEVAKAYHTAFPDIRTEIHDVMAEGDQVAVRCTAHGTHLGEFMGVAPTGRAVAIPWLMIARVADGKLVEGWEELDLLRVFQALGAPPPMAAAV